MDPNNNLPNPQPKDTNLVPEQPAIITNIDSSQPVIITPTSNPAPITAPTVTNSFPAATPLPYVTPAPASVTSGIGGEPLPPLSAAKKSSKKLIVGGLVGLVLLVAGGAAFYFGYYTNSSLAYSQALSSSGKALGQATQELTTKSTAAPKGYIGSGTYKVESTDFSTDGKLTFKSNDTSSETTFDVGVGVSRVDVAVRTFKSAAVNPDVYLKAGGIRGLGDMVGPEFGALTTKYDDKWIVIDHTLLDNVQKQLTETKAATIPTSQQIISEVNAFSGVNQQYLFSTDAETAVTTIRNDYGLKTVDDRKVFHYEVGFNKPNLKKYIKAQQTALKASELNGWIEQGDYAAAVEDSFAEAVKAVDDIKDTDTFDMYVDANKRIIYKLRFDDSQNSAVSYVDVGLDYKGSDDLPFFVRGQTTEGDTITKFDLRVTGNSKTKVVSLKLAGEDNSDYAYKTSADFSFRPSSDDVTIALPKDAVQLATLFEEIGLGDPFDTLSAAGETLGVSTSSSKTKPAPFFMAPKKN